MTYDLDWDPVQKFVAGLELSSSLPIPGTPEWTAADSAVRFIALVPAGSRWVLETQIAQRRNHLVARKDAALEICEAKDWAAVARQIRERNDFYRTHSWAKRVIA